MWQKCGVVRWKKTARGTDAWKLILKDAKVLQGPYSQWRKKKNWGNSAVKKILQKYALSASAATGQTKALATCKTNKKKKVKLSKFFTSPIPCHMTGDKQVISDFKSQYMQESHILSKHAVHVKLCLLNRTHIK